MNTETSYLTLAAAAESMCKQLVDRRDTKWHGKQSYERIQYRIERLDQFQTFCELAAEFE